MHIVAVLALDQVIPFDLATPIEVFGRVGGGRYEVRVCAPTETVDAGTFTLAARWGLEALLDADTIILPGCADVAMVVPEEVLTHLRKAAAGGTRIASICAGTFV